MIEQTNAPAAVNDEAVVATRAPAEVGLTTRWQSRMELDRYRAETERLRVLADFLARPVHAHGGAEPDPDIITAYNLAVEAALQGIRAAASAQ